MNASNTSIMVTSPEEDQNMETKRQLRYILNLSKRDNKVEIMKQPNLKAAHIYCKINQLSGQVSGPLL